MCVSRHSHSDDLAVISRTNRSIPVAQWANTMDSEADDAGSIPGNGNQKVRIKCAVVKAS